MIELSALRHAYPMISGFYIDRKNGHPEYTFLHFFNSVELLCNGEIIKTEPHAFIIYSPHTPQYYKCNSPVLHDWIHFNGDISYFVNKINFEFDKIYYSSQGDFITEITKELETEFYGEKHKREEILEIKFLELFIKLDRAVLNNNEPKINIETQEKLRFLRGKMFSCLENRWNVGQMAKEVGFSQSRFYSLYKSFYGISPTADLINARINSAKNLLSISNMTIREISETLGYENTSHFIRQFKANVGLSPTAWRILQAESKLSPDKFAINKQK